MDQIDNRPREEEYENGRHHKAALYLNPKVSEHLSPSGAGDCEGNRTVGDFGAETAP
jgi:hypothetical protein